MNEMTDEQLLELALGVADDIGATSQRDFNKKVDLILAGMVALQEFLKLSVKERAGYFLTAELERKMEEAIEAAKK